MAKNRSVKVTLAAIFVVAVALWFGGGWLWRMLLAMHGIHH